MDLISAKCPNCGAKVQLDASREEGFCSFCGSKVKVEEAKKLLIEGTVKLDNSEELANLYQIARRAKDQENSENASKYYDMILIKDPSSWEATFYVTYYQAMQCKIGEIYSAAMSIYNCEKSVLELVRDNVTNEEQQVAVISEITDRVIYISSMLFNAAKSHYEGIDAQIQSNYLQEYINNAFAAKDVLYNFGDWLEQLFESKYLAQAANSWKNGIEIHKDFVKWLQDKETNVKLIDAYAEKIKIVEPDYVKPEVETSGCYVATAVYGSYDCPEVWTLRRFRDFTLAESIGGRLFIKLYYATSPTLVKWLGTTSWFKNLIKPALDKMVYSLQNKGVESTPYQDRPW